MSGTHRRLPVTNRRKVGMTSSHHAPYVQGYTRATLAGTEGCDTARGSESQKAGLGSDWRLKLASMKVELLVIPDQQRRGEYVPGSCTHRPSHHESGQHPKPVTQPIGREPSKVGLVIGVKREQGSRTGRCGWITSFLGSSARQSRPIGLMTARRI